MRFRGSLTVAFSLALWPHIAAGQDIQIEDSEFQESDWVHAIQPNSEKGTETVTRRTSADNPSGYQEGDRKWNRGYFLTSHLYHAQTYVPSTSGPISSVDLHFRFRMVSGSGADDTGTNILVQQDGYLYATGGWGIYSNVATGWHSGLVPNVTAEDLGRVGSTGIDFNVHPDFSCNGGPITFGYTVIAYSVVSNNRITWDMDDFLVTIHAASRDCNDNGISDACELGAGTASDCDGNDLLDECDPDCDGNGVPDTCEMDPTDPDGDGVVQPNCNGNHLPDNCELLYGWADDCNSNDLPDRCEIDDGHRIIVGWGTSNAVAGSIPAGNDFAAVSEGANHGLALRSDGSIVGFGGNDYGEINVPTGNDFVAVSAGGYHSLALRADGTIAGWGRNNYGQTIPPAGNDFVAISAGSYFSLALRRDGTIVGWGDNGYGQTSAPPATTTWRSVRAAPSAWRCGPTTRSSPGGRAPLTS